VAREFVPHSQACSASLLVSCHFPTAFQFTVLCPSVVKHNTVNNDCCRKLILPVAVVSGKCAVCVIAYVICFYNDREPRVDGLLLIGGWEWGGGRIVVRCQYLDYEVLNSGMIDV
jgi:hypothetical protein